MVKSYQLLNDFKHYEPNRKSTTPVEGVSFAQRQAQSKASRALRCFKCNKLGVTIKNCPVCNEKDDLDDKKEGKGDANLPQVPLVVTGNNSKNHTLLQTDRSGGDDGTISNNSQFGMCQYQLSEHTNVDPERLRNSVLLDSESTCHIFCNTYHYAGLNRNTMFIYSLVNIIYIQCTVIDSYLYILTRDEYYIDCNQYNTSNYVFCILYSWIMNDNYIKNIILQLLTVIHIL